MKQVIAILLCVLLLATAAVAAEQADVTVDAGETMEVNLIPGSLVNFKMGEGAKLDFNYQSATGSIEILDITTKETKVKISKNDGWAKRETLTTSEKFELDLGGNALSEIDITPKLVKNNGEAVIIEFNVYSYTNMDGEDITFDEYTKEEETKDPYMKYFYWAIAILLLILICVWKKGRKKEERIEMPSVPKHFDEEEVYVAGTVQRTASEPQIPTLSILKEEPKEQAKNITPTKVAVKGVKVATPKKKTKKKVKKKKVKKATKKTKKKAK